MHISRTNFPIKSDDYETTEANQTPPASAPAPNPTPAPAYAPVNVRRSAPPVAQASAHPMERLQSAGYVLPDAATAPISKRMFSLSENVRFTRTPDSELQKGKEQPAPTPVQVSTAQKAAPVGFKAPVAPPRPPVVQAAPAQPERSPVLAGKVPTVSIEEKHENTVAASSPAKEAASSAYAYVSDFAFWDSMGVIADVAPVTSAYVRPKKIQYSPDEITARFRIVEYKKALAAEAIDPQLLAPSAPEKSEDQLSAAFTGNDTIETVVEASVEESPAPIVQQQVVVQRREIAPQPAPAPAQTLAPQRRLAIVGGIETRMAPPTHVGYEKPPVDLLQEHTAQDTITISQETLEQNAGLLESVLEDFGIRGEIIHVRPGPVVTLYEFEPAPGVKSSRVIGLADDIARSMSALSARVAVVPGRNVIGIELPNTTRETVFLREMIESDSFDKTKFKLALCLGKTIGGEPVIAELAKMPHLLVAGTTGSGKSVAINTMILSLLYRLTPDECRLIMVDPKMLELSIYDGIPHLLTPVVTDPKKAVMALKWAVREMEDRYRKMSKLGVRNIDGFNARVASAREKGETVMCTVQTGFDKGTGTPEYEQEEMDLTAMPYIVIIVDEMADLMMVAGKDIEGAIQRLAQMARAAGIHLIMATQRPSVDVITGTIKANFPTRISFQVTSKIDSRTILGEQGAEQLLGQGDMLHMIGGGRIARVHGPFVSDEEVEQIVTHLKAQGQPDYLDTVTADEAEEEEVENEDSAVFDKGNMASEDGNELYDQAVKIMLRDKKCSTSYIQRRLQIGYNRAASLVERMEKEGLVGPANHVGKREILNENN
ncbi:S-DNA-T family DNA segregation ATPase FtsK/SpoIIIE [Phyllobacterium ifriqiyense]|uniref:S-DNA-T family DNA segregation ATPase FtsK/SpoIIIE n=2 Tax=Phyllobacterium ifriqiyense TaxID=314238 RepID=A0ABU0S5H5_9HYPH|nr:S-DNA-T family DNA segregation ATPase FtsK/SpoIIIE [Phyllobacterium ifriqiyense]